MSNRSRDFPENGELVVCSVTSVKNFGAFVKLDEYGDKEGFIHVRDVASGWVKYIKDYVREGQKIVCKVLGVDHAKGHIDLSLKAVNEHQKREKIQQWKNETKAEKLIEFIAEKLSVSVDDAYDLFGNELLSDYDSLYDAFESAVSYTEDFKDSYSGEWVDVFLEVASENITPPSVQIESILELTSSAPDGMERIKNALIDGLKAAGDGSAEITCVGCPRYRLVVTAAEYKEAEETMKLVTDRVLKNLLSNGGTAVVKRENK